MNRQEIEALKKRVEEQKKYENIHKPYSERSGDQADFQVEYLLDIDPSLHGINIQQGMRADFLYEGDDPATDGVHMIWPEFIDKSGKVITDKSIPIEDEGDAIMWINSQPEFRDIHKDKLRVGAKGYWVVGSKRVARVVVTKILKSL